MACPGPHSDPGGVQGHCHSHSLSQAWGHIPRAEVRATRPWQSHFTAPNLNFLMCRGHNGCQSQGVVSRLGQCKWLAPEYPEALGPPCGLGQFPALFVCPMDSETVLPKLAMVHQQLEHPPSSLISPARTLEAERAFVSGKDTHHAQEVILAHHVPIPEFHSQWGHGPRCLPQL